MTHPLPLARRRWLAGALCLLATAPALAADAFEGDPYQSHPWSDMRREFLGAGEVVWDARVQVSGPAFAEDPMNVPVSVSVDGLTGIERIVILVDRNPIRKVLEYQPLAALPRVSFRFKLEQASPVRAAVRTADGRWHVGGTWVDSSGGGCTVSGATRKDGSWSRTLGTVSSRVFERSEAAGSASGAADTIALDAGSRIRVRVMHPMDTGLVAGVPAFYLSKLTLRDGADRELLRLQPFEPVSENPVFSFDFPVRPAGPLRLVGVDNNGNRIDSRIE
ncbi:quinoprotein dehydrogenase-associated SoxYZ-like carrier [Sphaerotilus mobilis]|uniref:Sulfur-oxidizing protein SoxY n=1 Tax=Sphaerotilus mobilis TaxID=47994 RepID=A0A4Q7LSC6_9BURK|nr:quinoprotein dehydrogenase-associated SoxYZ-like carrier [Sphaerotilus mobilis]RZS56808.1 sulfur-oxidizing protein SoxY [Sphaerotilus mobilis]